MLIGLLAGCNNLLSLDPPEADRDLDGVSDRDDNCPDVANPQQRDNDRNGLGDVCDCAVSNVDLDGDGEDDACDDCVGEAMGVDSGGNGIDDGCEPCPAATGVDVDNDGVDDTCDACTLGPPHDEDGDGVADACDNCPTQSNADQTGSGVVGTACARSIETGTQTFDPLVDQDLALWPGIPADWTWQNDGLDISADVSRTTRFALSAPYLVETRVTTATRLLLACATSNAATNCSYLRSSGKVTLTVGSGLTGGGLPNIDLDQVAWPSSGAVRLQLRVDEATQTSFCEVLDANGKSIATAQLARYEPCTRLKVAADRDTHLDYVWTVSQ